MKAKFVHTLMLIVSLTMIHASAWAGLPSTEAPTHEANRIWKNRYITFVPHNNGTLTAIRVKLTSLYHPPSNPPNATDYSAYEGQYRWVGAPSDYPEGDGINTLRAAALQCEPYYMNWGPVGLINVYGIEVIPSSVYDVQAIHQLCDPNFESCYSAGLQVLTGKWGDIEIPFAHETTTTQPDFSDISAMVNKFRNNPTAISKARAQLYNHSVNPAVLVDFSDISEAVNTFRGQLYSYSGPSDCPPAKASSNSTTPSSTQALE